MPLWAMNILSAMAVPWNCSERLVTIGSQVKDNFGKAITGTVAYFTSIARYKNGCFRFRVGPEFGAVERKFFVGLEAGFEYNYVFQNGWEFALIQKNNVNFVHGDTFRNGILIGLKIPF